MLETHVRDVRAIQETLELAGVPADLDFFETPEAVLAASSQGRPDIAIVNLELPGAPALLEELSVLGDTRPFPIIAFAEDGLKAEHADHIFPKPQDEAEYMGVVAAFASIGWPRLPRLRRPLLWWRKSAGRGGCPMWTS